ncbi:hypothetical protein BDD12DRAFT_877613 [Trichophaea hybrida]|nr:hypothetical protein BDD12DRAFT_877613 [Trichophaea hybrida]
MVPSQHVRTKSSSSTIAVNNHLLGSIKTAELVAKAISKDRNQRALPHTLGAPTFHRVDVMVFLHQYESLVFFTSTKDTKSSISSMIPYYCVEELTQDKVMMMYGYMDRNWAALKKEMLDVIQYSNSQPDSLV